MCMLTVTGRQVGPPRRNYQVVSTIIGTENALKYDHLNEHGTFVCFRFNADQGIVDLQHELARQLRVERLYGRKMGTWAEGVE